ncbi:MAG TPA: methyltransferase domain-containing protein, partial [Mycobacterium sp.]|nr:methyltransferase domain-containing protein [Mycobacterium sp.]
GAGGGSVARFMSDRAGPTGAVIATDINTDWIAGELPENVEVRRHDIGVDPLPEAAFDLVHARAVLTFVAERRSAVLRMIAALRPGGWLLVEELVPPITETWDPPNDPDVELARKARRAIMEVIRRRGGDLNFAQELPRYLTAAHMSEVGAEGYFVPFRSDAVAGLALANMDQLRPMMVEAGLMDAEEIDRYRAILERPDGVHPPSMALISVWGRR